MVWGWPIAGVFTLAVAEICSAYPTSGGLYFWSARLCSRRRWGPFASWLTGWYVYTTLLSYSFFPLYHCC
jgi:amino acid transporter